MLAIDMDGTLLNSENQISKRTEDAIKKAKKKGIQVVLSTGRILKSARNFSEDLQLKDSIISCNGAVIADEEHNIIYKKGINREIANSVMELGRIHNIYYHFYSDTGLYSNTHIEDVIGFYNDQNIKDEKRRIRMNVFINPREIFDNNIEICKFLFMDKDGDKLKVLREELSLIDKVNVCSSWNNNIEIMDMEVSKGYALDYISKRLGILKEEIIAIGDNENDISMLKYAGLGVAMGNAVEKTKKASDIITSTNDEDGVAKVIEKYILETGDEI